MVPDEVLNFMGKKNVLVTGGTGLIGRQVVRILSDAGSFVRTVSLDDLKAHDSVERVYGDLTDFSFCNTITRDMDCVFHVAGIKGSIDVTVRKPASFFVPLLMMNTNVLEACRINKVSKVVYTSSIGAYPSIEVLKESSEIEAQPPMDRFPGWAKRMAELQIQAYKIQHQLDNFSIVRLCNVYGPGDNFDPQNAMVIPSLMYKIYHRVDPIFVWGDGSSIREFAFSKDIAEGVILALYFGTKSRYVNLGSGYGYTIRQLVETLQSIVPFRYKFDPTKSSGFSKRVLDISLARNLLGYNPSTTLREGLKITWEWYIRHSEEHLAKKNYFRD